MNRDQRRKREQERQWQHLTDLLCSRYAVTGQGLPPRAVRDLIDDARDQGRTLAEFAAARGLSGEPTAVPGGWGDRWSIALLLESGWPVNAYDQIAEIAEHARGVGAYVVKASTTGGQAAAWLANVAEPVCARGARWVDLVGWLEVLAQIADPFLADPIWTAIVNWNIPGDSRIEAGRIDAVADWAEAFGPLGALVWAAGLPYAEAVAQRDAGVLEGSGLAVLAALRGYRMSVPEPVPAAV